MSSSQAFWATAQNLMTYLSLTEAGTMWSLPDALILLRSFSFSLSDPTRRKQTKPSYCWIFIFYYFWMFFYSNIKIRSNCAYLDFVAYFKPFVLANQTFELLSQPYVWPDVILKSRDTIIAQYKPSKYQKLIIPKVFFLSKAPENTYHNLSDLNLRLNGTPQCL